MNKLTVLRIIFISLTVILLVFIFIMSAQPADESAELSLSFDYRLCRFFRPDFDSLSEEEQLKVAAEIDHFVRKTAHFLEFSALGALLFADFTLFKIKRGFCILFAFLSGAAYAVSDEVHQLFVPGRSCEAADMLIDSGGVLAGSLFAFLIFLIIITVKAKKRDAVNEV